MHMPNCRQQAGFTLIEVMVALAILAVVAVMASQASGTYLRAVEQTKTRTFAHFVAQNTLADFAMGADPFDLSGGEQTAQVSDQGQQWQVKITPLPPTTQMAGIGATDQPNAAQPMLIQVAPMRAETAEVLPNVLDMTVTLARHDTP